MIANDMIEQFLSLNKDVASGLPLFLFTFLCIKIMMSSWTPILSATYDAYSFSACFLMPSFYDLNVIAQESLAHFSRVQINWMNNERPRCDLFLGKIFHSSRSMASLKSPFSC